MLRKYLTSTINLNHAEQMNWYHHWLNEKLQAIEDLLNNSKFTDSFCYGNEPTIADVFLVPQVDNAERFKYSLEPYPNIRFIYDKCMNHPAFMAAQPHLQPDASKYNLDDEY